MRTLTQRKILKKFTSTHSGIIYRHTRVYIMSLFLYQSAETRSQANHYTLPCLDKLFIDMRDICQFIPHWQIASICAAIKKEHSTIKNQDFWITKAFRLIETCATTRIYTATPFITQNDPINKLIINIKTHLSKTDEGRFVLNSIPGYPNNISLFNQQLVYTLLPVCDSLKNLTSNKPTVEFNTIVNKIAGNEDVYINLHNTLKVSDEGMQQKLIQSLLAWLMIHPKIQHNRISVVLDNSLIIKDIEPELYIQMAINGLSLEKHYNSKTTNCVPA